MNGPGADDASGNQGNFSSPPEPGLGPDHAQPGRAHEEAARTEASDNLSAHGPAAPGGVGAAPPETGAPTPERFIDRAFARLDRWIDKWDRDMQAVLDQRRARRPSRQRDPLASESRHHKSPDDVGGALIPTRGADRKKHTRLRILFVCPGNTARSQMCEAWARVYGFDAESAGTFPAQRVPIEAIHVMHEVGVDIVDFQTKLLDPRRLSAFDRVISIGGAVPRQYRGMVQVEEWPLIDPIGFPMEGYRALRSQTEKLVKGLAQRMGVKSTLFAR